MHPSATFPISRTGLRKGALAAAAVASAACATVRLPTPQVASAAAAAQSYSGSLRVQVKGDDVRGRSQVLIGFERPARLRLEIPGPSGARLVAVAAGERLTAVFPAERAVFETAATAEGLDALIGVALAPAELMDMLVGTAPARLLRYEASWDDRLPERIDARLPDGTRIKARVDDAEIGLALPAAAFAPPGHEGFRAIDAEEARRLLGKR